MPKRHMLDHPQCDRVAVAGSVRTRTTGATAEHTLAKLVDCDGKTVAVVREKLGLLGHESVAVAFEFVPTRKAAVS